MGETTAKVNLKISSTVASSILAQEKLNQIARDNIDFLGNKIAEGISYIMDNALETSTRDSFRAVFFYSPFRLKPLYVNE